MFSLMQFKNTQNASSAEIYHGIGEVYDEQIIHSYRDGYDHLLKDGIVCIMKKTLNKLSL